DPRGVAEKAEAYLKSTGIADTAFFGPEAEFFIFDDVRFSYDGNSSMHRVDSVEGHWNSAREEFPNLGYKIRPKEGYFPVSPMDSLQDIRNEMCIELERAGIPIERQHHEVATAGQAEIDIRFAPLKRMGDNLQYYKYILRNVAQKQNASTFARPMGRRIHISRSPRSCSPASMESRTASIPAIRLTKIFTICRRKNSRRSRACPIHSVARSKRSKPITPSSSAATSSTPTSSPPGST